MNEFSKYVGKIIVLNRGYKNRLKCGGEMKCLVNKFIAGVSFSKIIVIKIGGSCLVNKLDLNQLVSKIAHLKSSGVMSIVVVSAMKGVTDQLIDLIGEHGNNGGAHLVDGVLAQGEITSTKLIELKLNDVGIKATAILPDKNFPIITDDKHGDANILIAPTKEKIRDTLIHLINHNIMPVIPGFIGVTKKGLITTLGRGGSDTTAVIVGRAINADEVILLKDVDGIYNSDPKKGKANLISEIHVKDALEIVKNGAKVIHSKALTMKGKNPIRVVHKDEDRIFEKGTIIVGDLND